VLFIFLVVYFLLALITSGFSAPSGLVIPMMTIGGTMGRLIGLLALEGRRAGYMADDGPFKFYIKWMANMFISDNERDSAFVINQAAGRKFIAEDPPPDPGVYAMIGAAAFMGGSGRVTMFLAVVMIELTNDVTFMPAIALAVIIGTIVGNLTGVHGLYHALIPVQNLPYLEESPSSDMRKAPVEDIMGGGGHDLVTVHQDTVTGEALTNDAKGHACLPVVDESKRLVGLIMAEWWQDSKNEGKKVSAIMDLSPVTVKAGTRVSRAFTILRRVGLRCIVVVDGDSCPIGIITRKDLQPWNLHHHGHGHHGGHGDHKHHGSGNKNDHDETKAASSADVVPVADSHEDVQV
jgi:chloride channel 7